MYCKGMRILERKEYTGILFDRLAGTIQIYVENYLLVRNGGGYFKLEPSYKVDYEISRDIINYINQSLDGKAEDIWYFKIALCNSIDEIEKPLRTLVVQFLPRFFEMYPQYKDEECLKIRK